MDQTELLEKCYAERAYLFRLAKKYEKHDVDAEELVSQMMLNLAHSADLITYKEELFRGFLKKCLYRVFVNKYRKNKRDDTLKLDYIHEIGNPIGKNLGGETIDAEKIMQCINQLDPEIAKILNLRLDGFKYKQIAEKLQMPVGSVKTKVHSGRIELVNILKRNGINYVQILWFKNEYQSSRTRTSWSEDIFGNLFA